MCLDLGLQFIKCLKMISFDYRIDFTYVGDGILYKKKQKIGCARKKTKNNGSFT